MIQRLMTELFFFCHDQVIDGSVRSNLLSVEPICSKDLVWPRYPTQFLSSSNLLTVIMQTNNRLSGRGFRATYKHGKNSSDFTRLSLFPFFSFSFHRIRHMCMYC